MKNAILGVFASALAFGAHGDTLRILNGDVHFPEGPVWYQGKLYYVEYDRNSVTTWDGRRTRYSGSRRAVGRRQSFPPFAEIFS